MKKTKMIFIIALLIMFINSISFAENKLSNEEYQRRLNKAKEITASVSGSSSNKSSNVEASDSRTVYITSNGSRYHMPGCEDLDSTPHAITVSNADSKGYAPCSKCNPYGLSSANSEKTTYSSNKIIYVVIICMLLLIIYIIYNEYRYNKTIRKRRKISNFYILVSDSSYDIGNPIYEVPASVHSVRGGIENNSYYLKSMTINGNIIKFSDSQEIYLNSETKVEDDENNYYFVRLTKNKLD